ncbi:hypothetical protein D3C87_1781640 [compost metagenome]
MTFMGAVIGLLQSGSVILNDNVQSIPGSLHFDRHKAAALLVESMNDGILHERLQCKLRNV